MNVSLALKNALLSLVCILSSSWASGATESELAAAIALLESQGYTVTPPAEGKDPGVAPEIPFRTLSLAEIEQELDYWPVEVRLNQTIEFVGGRRAPEGAMLTIENISGGTLSVRYRDLYFDIAAAETDLVSRSSEIASGQSNFPGRFPALLAGRADVFKGGSLQKARAEDLAGADIYVVYMGSPSCGWCARFLPTMQDQLKKLEKQYPGQLKFIHASMRVPNSDYRGYLQKLEADAGLPPEDSYFADTLMAELNLSRISIPQPSVILANASGKVLAHASREDSSLKKLETLVKRDLAGFLEKPEEIRPRWMKSREG